MNVFQLSIPIHQENEINLQEYEAFETTATDADPIEENTAEGKMPLLLVEDNKEILQFIQRELSSQFYIHRAHNGQEALEVLATENIEVVISDIMMPVMDGIELCRQMKTDIQYSHIPIILLTARNTLNSKIEGLEVGADAYIENHSRLSIYRHRLTTWPPTGVLSVSTLQSRHWHISKEWQAAKRIKDFRRAGSYYSNPYHGYGAGC